MAKKVRVIRMLKKPKLEELKTLKQTKFEKYASTSVLGAIAGHLLLPGVGGIVVGALSAGALGKVIEKDKKMAKVPVFYSFHFDNDVMRTQQIRNMGIIEGNPSTTPNDWEQLKRSGDKAIENWIDNNMKYKRCVVVLIGNDTASRPWVQYEIAKAWNDGKALIGIYIHNLKCPRNGTSRKGVNPFEKVTFKDGRNLANYVSCYEPSSHNTYSEIANNISHWIKHAINNKTN